MKKNFKKLVLKKSTLSNLMLNKIDGGVTQLPWELIGTFDSSCEDEKMTRRCSKRVKLCCPEVSVTLADSCNTKC